MNKQLILIFQLIIFCSGQRKLIVYTDSHYNDVGNSLTITNNVTDVRPAFSPGLITSPKRICTTGMWITYSQPNYTGTAQVLPKTNSWSGLSCSDVNFKTTPVESARYVGPEAEHISVITLFSDINFEGDHIAISGPANAHLPFHPRSLLITGNRYAWLLYTDTNFNGTRTCYEKPSVVGTYRRVASVTAVGSLLSASSCNY